MRRLRFLLAALAVGALAAGPLAGAAGARVLAPTYQSSDPEDGSMMDHPPSEVTATFSEPLDPSSTMSVFDECGAEIDSGPATVNLNEMQVGIGKTPSGTYKVVYVAVGVAGVTGQTKGSFDFMVHHGQPCKKGTGHDHGKRKDKDHDDHRRRDDDHDDHEDDDHDGMGSGPGHSRTHSSGTMHDGGHMPSGGDHGSGHGDGHGDHGDKPGPGGGGGTAENPNPPVASGPTGGAATADAQAMLIGLGLALLVGVLGGWLLRNGGGLAGPA
ncbi:MAG: copper resistance protein CopC [Actinomycetota bacterium]|nr:copper resistance protein CopC [Actinomycetota bacterium]